MAGLALPYLWNDEQTEAKLAMAGGRVAGHDPAGGGDQLTASRTRTSARNATAWMVRSIPIGPKARNLSANGSRRWSALGISTVCRRARIRCPMWEIARRLQRRTGRARLSRCQLRALPSARRDRVQQRARPALGAGRSQSDRHHEAPGRRRTRGGRACFTNRARRARRIRSCYTAWRAPSPGVAMPELGKSSVDADGVKVIRKWIAAMPRQ